MKNIKTPSIFTQLILLIAVTILVPLIFFGYTTYNSYKADIETQIINSNFNTLNQAEQNVSNLVGEISSILNYYDNNLYIKSYLTDQFTGSYGYLQDSITVEENLQNYLSTINWINCDIILVGVNEHIFTTSNHSPRLNATSIWNTAWYNKTKQFSGTTNWFVFDHSYFTKNNIHPVVVATKQLYEYVHEIEYGTIIIEIDESYIYNIYKDIIKENEFFIIQDSDGNIISTSDRTVQLSLNSSYSRMPVESKQLIYDYNYKGEDYIYLSQKSSVSDWTFIKLLSANQIHSEISQLQKTFIIICIICMILISIGVYMIAQRILQPIKDLTLKIQSNYIRTPESIPSNDSKPLTSAFTSYELLIKEVDDTVAQLVSENEARFDAELHALKMQINPHFLYNTLNSIKCLVWTQKIDYIEPTITAMVKLLQQTLRSPSNYITLDAEIEILKSYVYIQNIRTDNSIHVNYNVQKSDLDALVPSLILQPIIENSIFHGIEPTGKVGTITISSYRCSKDLHIEVLDNGVGIKPEILANLLKKKTEGKHRGFNGIALMNIQERLQMYYGSSYGLRITSREGIGTSITVILKYTTNEQEYKKDESNDC